MTFVEPWFKLLKNALNCRFGSLISCESFHADVHAGNLWLLRDGRIGFIDFGMLEQFLPSVVFVLVDYQSVTF